MSNEKKITYQDLITLKKKLDYQARGGTKIILWVYEIGCFSFSQIIIADSLQAAIRDFERLNPNETVIWAQNNDIVNHPTFDHPTFNHEQ